MAAPCWAAGQIGESTHPGQRVSTKDRQAVAGPMVFANGSRYGSCPVGPNRDHGSGRSATTIGSWPWRVRQFGLSGADL
jgi:hypothetical protein